MSPLTLLTVGLIAAYGSTATISDDTSRNTLQDHQASVSGPDPLTGQSSAVTEIVNSCLSAPTRSCALTSALMVTADEELPIIRVDLLMAIAETLIEIGDIPHAGETVDLARQAAEDIGISIGTEQKLAQITGMLTAIGRLDEAMDIVASLDDRFLKADALGAIAMAQAKNGQVQEAQTTLDQINEPLLALRYAAEITERISENSEFAETVPVDALENRLASVDHRLLKALGESRLATIEARRGDMEKAQELDASAFETLPSITANHERARLYAALAMTRHAMGDGAGYEDYVNRAANLAAPIRSDYDRTIAIADAVAALSLGKHVERATALAGEITDLREQSALITRLSRKESTHAIVKAYADHVLRTAQTSDSRFERDRARLAIASALGKVAAVDQAVLVISGIEHFSARARALAVLARSID